MNINKRYVYLFIILLILIIGVIFVNAVVSKTIDWQLGDEIKVKIDNDERTLQSAIDNDLFKDSPKPVQLVLSILSPGHSFDEIWVSVNGNEMNFSDAISTTDICGISSPSTSYSTTLDPGHLATEIEVTTLYDGQTKSLQDAINDGSLVNIDGDWTTWSGWIDTGGCSVSCGGGTKPQERTRTCTNPAPFCGGLNCVGSATETRTVSCNTQACPPPPPTTGTWQLSNCLNSFGQCIGIPCTAQGGSCTLGATTTCFIGSGFPGSCSHVCTLTCA